MQILQVQDSLICYFTTGNKGVWMYSLSQARFDKTTEQYSEKSR